MSTSEPGRGLSTMLRRHRRIGIDSNVLIYLMEGSGPEAPIAAALLEALGVGDVRGVASSIVLTEVLSGPARADAGSAFEAIAAELRLLPGLDWVPVSAEIAVDAGWLRGHGLPDLGDAIAVATARASGATALVTNDRRIRSRPQLEVVYLDDLEPTI